MKLLTTTLALAAATTLVAAASGQPPEFPTPQEEHAWLEQFVGQWTSKSKTTSGAGQPTMECTGKMSSRMFGGFWVVNQLEGDIDGQTFQGLQTIGYDAEKKVYVGTWVDSMMNHLWRYEGKVHKSGKRLVLMAEGPNFLAGEGTVKYRDSYEFASPDRIITISEMQNDQGGWLTFMTGEMTRVK